MDNVETQAPVEPAMPTVPTAPENAPEVNEYEEANPPVESESETPTDDTSEKQGETPSDDVEKTEKESVDKSVETDDTSKQFDDIIEGWKEDREVLSTVQKENVELKQKLARLEERETTEDEYGELSEEDRIDAIVKKREQESVTSKQAEQDATQKEIRFYERTDKDFAENKAEILDIAVKFNAQNLSQAIMIWKGQQAVKTKTPMKKKAEASVPTKAKVNPIEDNHTESIGDMYRQGGVN